MCYFKILKYLKLSNKISYAWAASVYWWLSRRRRLSEEVRWLLLVPFIILFFLVVAQPRILSPQMQKILPA